MFLLRLIFKNALRHRLRTGLTILGIVIAVTAFGLLRTVVDAWYAGVEAASATRLVTRNAISLVFSLPLSYRERISRVDGVSGISTANWFGGIYISERNFFPQFAVDAPTYLELYPEIVLTPEEKRAFLLDRKGAIVGSKLAAEYGWKVGDTIPLRGTIFPGTWNFTIRGIFEGADKTSDVSTMYFHWQLLNETIKKQFPRRGDQVGVYIVGLKNPNQVAEVSEAIDQLFKNSLAETLTETEKAFQLGFVSMTEQILVAIEAVSFVVIIIIMAVVANTMVMTARERSAEFATLRALGFSNGFIAFTIFGESLLISLFGAALAIACTFPIAAGIGEQLGKFFPIFIVSDRTVLMQAGAAVIVGCVAAAVPAWRASRVAIVDGLRAVA